jgi:hypothetical protein
MGSLREKFRDGNFVDSTGILYCIKCSMAETKHLHSQGKANFLNPCSGGGNLHDCRFLPLRWLKSGKGVLLLYFRPET